MVKVLNSVLTTVLSVSCLSVAFADDGSEVPADPAKPTKPSFFYLGYNRSFYAPSNIRFRGHDHNFELKNVTATDRPSTLSEVYLTDVSVPQYNIRWGRNFAPNWNLSIGIDHMKYVVEQGQTVMMSGTIESSASEKYKGEYANTNVVLTEDFLQFEHTDGLNFVSAELETQHSTDFLPWHELSLIGGIGFGPVVPRSDVRLFGQGKNHFWNLSGWGFSMHVGIQADFLKRYFLRFTGKYGRIDLKFIPTTGDSRDKAEQLIHFMENYLALGIYL